MQERDRIAIKALVEKLKSIPRLKAIILFGSLARGEVTPDSDIDILIIIDSPRSDDYLEQVSKIITEIDSERDICPILTNLKDCAEDFLASVFEEGILLYGEVPRKKNFDILHD